MSEILFTSAITVDEIQFVGSDEMIARAAWVSTGLDLDTPDGKPIMPERVSGVIGFLMKNRHGTPFEHGTLTVRVHAPIKVWREWHRHRVGWNFSETSGRYKDLDPVFYIPPACRPMIRPQGFKSARPAFDLPDVGEYETICYHLRESYRNAYGRYLALLALGVDRGLARDVLGVGIYSACYCTANPRSIMHFLELRTNEPSARRPSKPLYEIEVAARKLEEIFARRWPFTYAAWQENGRAAP